MFDSNANRPEREWGRYGLLLVALLVQLAVLPFLGEPLGDAGDGVLLRLGWSVVILTGLLVASRDRRILWIALLLAIPVLALRWSAGYYDIPIARLALPVSSALFLIFTAGVVLKTIFLEQRVTLDEIFGGVLVYLLMGVVFGQLHYALELANPGAYLLGDVALSSTSSGSDWNLRLLFRYFSFTTLTTLGYGDIRPQFHVAQVLSVGEALIGQLYLAIFIARLVGGYISQRRDS